MNRVKISSIVLVVMALCLAALSSFQTAFPQAQNFGRSGSDPCQNPGVAKSSVAVSLNTVTTTLLVAAATGKSIYVCGGFLNIATSGTTPNSLKFEYGTQTATACDTGTTALTGTLGTQNTTTSLAAEAVIIPGGFTNFSTSAGQQLCAVSAGTAVNDQGYISYVQQ